MHVRWTAIGFAILAYLLPAYLLVRTVFITLDIGWLGTVPDDQRWAEIRNGLFVVAAALGAPFVIWRTVLVAQQTAINQQTHFTDLYAKAVEMLGADKSVKEEADDGATVERTVPNIEVRLGAIYALERIARQSDDDYRPIVETLCAYIKHNGPSPVSVGSVQLSAVPCLDLRAVLSVLSRIDQDRRAYLEGASRYPLEGYSLNFEDCDAEELKKLISEIKHWRRNEAWRPDLSGASLQGMQLNGYNFRRFELTSARLESANLRNVRLEGATLSQAWLESVDLSEGHLEGALLAQARLDGATLSGAMLVGATLNFAKLGCANLSDAALCGADLDQAIAENANLNGARLTGAKMNGMRLSRADLTTAQLDGANLSNAYLEGTIFSNARLKQTNLSAVHDLTFDQLASARGDASTILPDTVEGEPAAAVRERLRAEHGWL